MCVIFLLQVLSSWSSTFLVENSFIACSCQTHRSGVICHPFLLGCLGELHTPLQHFLLFKRVKNNHGTKNRLCEFLIPKLGSQDSAESSWIICMEMDRCKQLAEISKTWRFCVLSQALIHVELPGHASFSLVLTLCFRSIQSPTQEAEIVHDWLCHGTND